MYLTWNHLVSQDQASSLICKLENIFVFLHNSTQSWSDIMVDLAIMFSLKTYARASETDLLRNILSTMKISHLLMCKFISEKSYVMAKNCPAELRPIWVYVINTCTHLKYLIIISVHPVCYKPYLPTASITNFKLISDNTPFAISQ